MKKIIIASVVIAVSVAAGVICANKACFDCEKFCPCIAKKAGKCGCSECAEAETKD